jgi:hypothetical protein
MKNCHFAGEQDSGGRCRGVLCCCLSFLLPPLLLSSCPFCCCWCHLVLILTLVVPLSFLFSLLLHLLLLSGRHHSHVFILVSSSPFPVSCPLTPCFHPMSSCLQQWGMVLGARLLLLSPCPPPLVIVPLSFPLLLPIVNFLNKKLLVKWTWDEQKKKNLPVAKRCLFCLFSFGLPPPPHLPSSHCYVVVPSSHCLVVSSFCCCSVLSGAYCCSIAVL